MIIGTDFAFLELQKTGSSHVRKVLGTYYGDRLTYYPRHKPFYLLEREGSLSGTEKVLCTIRNPWDWYVSLWSYGRMGKGGFYNRLTGNITRPGREPVEADMTQTFTQLYASNEERGAFKKWLAILLFDEDFHPGEGYHQNEVSSVIGLYTYRLMRCCCSSFPSEGIQIKDQDQLSAFMIKYLKVDTWLRMEALNENIILSGAEMGMNKEKLTQILDDLPGRSNASVRRPYSHYFDDESRLWVQERDRWIIHNFNYSF